MNKLGKRGKINKFVKFILSSDLRKNYYDPDNTWYFMWEKYVRDMEKIYEKETR